MADNIDFELMASEIGMDLPELGASEVPKAGELDSSPNSETLSLIESAMRDTTASTAASVEALESAAAESSIANEIIESSITDIADASQTVQSVKLTADLEAQNNTIEAFESLGGREAQISLLEEYQQDAARTNELLDKKIDLADDVITKIPFIDAFINEFRGIQTSVNLQAAIRKENHTAQELTNIAAFTQGAANTAALTKHTLNSGAIQANLEGLSSKADADLANQQLANAKNNAEAVTAVFNMRSKEVTNLLAKFRLEGEVEGRELSKARNKLAFEELKFRRESLESSKESTAANLELTQLKLKAAKNPTALAALEAQQAKQIKSFNDIIATENSVVNAVQLAQTVYGRPESRELILLGLKQTGAAGRKYDALLEIGSSSDITLGSTPWDATTNLDIISPSGNFARSKNTELLDQIGIIQAAKYTKPNVDAPSNVATLEADFNSTAREFADLNATNIKTGDSTNPYQAPPMSVIKGMTAVQESVAYQKVFKAFDFQEADPQSFMDAAVSGIQAKSIKIEDAAEGIKAIFNGAAIYNNTMAGGYSRIGFPTQNSYNAIINIAPTSFQKLIAAPTIQGAAFDAAKDLLADRDFGTTTGARFKDRTISLDFMSEAQITQALVRLLAVAKPIEDKPSETSETSEPAEK